jgi:hypothetical protein
VLAAMRLTKKREGLWKSTHENCRIPLAGEKYSAIFSERL